MLTQDELKTIIHYNPETGIFTNRVDRNPRSKKGEKITRGGPNYIFTQINKQNYMVHKLAFLYMLGEFPSTPVDHINRDRIDNRWVNLRIVTHAENCRNLPPRTHYRGVPVSCSATGVSWDTGRGKWFASICYNEKQLNLGRYDNLFDACCARKSAEHEYGFHPNHGRIL